MAWNVVDSPSAQSGDRFGRWQVVGRDNGDQRMGALDAGWRGFQDGLTFNLDDEFAGLVGGDAEKARVRAEQERARTERPGWYGAGEFGSALVPIGVGGKIAAIGKGANLAREALAGAGAASNAAKTGNGILSAMRSLAGAAAGGAAYGTAYRLGDAEGDLGQRMNEISPATALTDAAFGAGGFTALAGLGAVAKGGARFFQQRAAQNLFDRQTHAADAAVGSAEREASALLPYGAADAAREDAVKRMIEESIARSGANPNSLHAMAQRFGITLPRSMAQADRSGKQWLWEAWDGVHGPQARKESERIVTQLFHETPDAFMRVMGEDGVKLAPPSSVEGMSDVRSRLQMQNELERQTENQAWESFNPVAAQFRFSQKGDAGLPTLAREVDARLEKRRVFFNHENPEMSEIYRRMYPRAALARDAVKLYVDGVSRGRPGSLEDVVNLRRYVSDAYDAARDDADRGAVYSIQQGLDDWLEHSMGSNIRQKGQQVARQFEGANQATQRNRELFQDNKHVAKIVAEEGDAERALSTLIGARGVNPQAGAHLTMRALRQRLGDTNDTWRTLKLSILRRFSDPLEEAVNRDNPHAFRTAYNGLDSLLKNHNEFLTETFTPNERFRLEQLRGVLRQMQTPAPGASNPSRSGITGANLLQALLPGAKTAGDIFRDAVLSPRAARAEMQAAKRPDVLGPTMKSALGGMLTGPDSFWLSAAAGAAQARAAQDRDRRELEGAPAYAF